jgi:hypothetical protein
VWRSAPIEERERMRGLVRERGEGRAGCAFWVVVLIIITMIGFKVVPVKFASAKFYDYMYEQAKYAQRSKPDDIKKIIMRKARELNLPVDPKKVIVKKRGGRILIEAEYTVDIEFPGYTYIWDFEERIDEPIFIW